MRAMAGSQVGVGTSAAGENVQRKTYIRVSERNLHTEPVSEQRSRCGQVVLQLIVNEAKGEDQEVEEDPDEEEQATATLIDHPDLPLVEGFLGLGWPLWDGATRIRPLKGLQTPPLGPVSLEVTGLGGPIGICVLEVRMLVQVGEAAAVGKVEARRPLQLVEVGRHEGLENGWGRERIATRASCACVGVAGVNLVLFVRIERKI